MSRKQEKLTATFQAAGSDGCTYTVNVFTTFIESVAFGRAASWVEGTKRIATEDGQPCNRLDKGRYQMVLTGLVLTSADPSAP